MAKMEETPKRDDRDIETAYARLAKHIQEDAKRGGMVLSEREARSKIPALIESERYRTSNFFDRVVLSAERDRLGIVDISPGWVELPNRNAPKIRIRVSMIDSFQVAQLLTPNGIYTCSALVGAGHACADVPLESQEDAERLFSQLTGRL